MGQVIGLGRVFHPGIAPGVGVNLNKEAVELELVFLLSLLVVCDLTFLFVIMYGEV